ncbi:hypothetical protein K438DRAFT_2168168, partial [Mycena galopus ATCC 62051]
APAAFTTYLKGTWMKNEVVFMWSGVYRTRRSIFVLCDTNMLVEAWHHVLKGKFFQGKRNRRLDHLIHTLVECVLTYYALKQRRQALGFEGPDIEVKKHINIEKRSQLYTLEDIEHVVDRKYIVASQTCPSKSYNVDIDTYTCSCEDFPQIEFCKHICGVQRLFPEDAAQADIPSTPAVPASASCPPSGPTPTPTECPQELVPTTKHGLTLLAEKVEHVTACIHRFRKKDVYQMHELEAACDTR